MKLVTIDFETFWSQTHTLSKMNPIEYVLHPDTEIISAAIKTDNGETEVYFGEAKVREALDAVLWDQAMVIGHNMSAFDAMILAWRFGVKPKVWGCTLAMARPIHSKTTGNSLAALVKHYKLGEKDSAALVNTKGKRLKDFTKDELREMRAYNKADTDQCYALFQVLRKHYSAAELWQIDATIRMLVEPKFILNRRVLDSALSDERVRKHQSLVAMAKILHGDNYVESDDVQEDVRAELASAPKFAKLLESRGVSVPMKVSPSNPEKRIPALSKTDEAFLALQEHDDEVVAMAAAARLDVKSTILQTRLEMFITVGKQLRGRLPIPLHYCGADTTGRWSGFMYNPQNLPRINPDKPKLSDALRKSMVAPPGYKVVVADLSGIELRVNHFLWQVPSSMALYKASPDKADLYKDFAARLYGVALSEVTKEQRQIGKVAHLGLGFGAGPGAFQKVAKTMGGVDLSLQECEKVTYRWRDEYQEIVQGWRTCHDLLNAIAQGDAYEVDPWGLIRTEKNALVLPSGRRIRYPELHTEENDNGRSEWWYGAGRNRARIYAGKIDENCIAEGTLVLTDSGWKPIENVERTDMVHDGVEFVRHDGIVFKSVQSCVTVDGVYMTPDHEVLTDEGWQEASQVQRPYWLRIWGTDGDTPGAFDGAIVEVAVPVPVRKADSETGLGRNQGDKTWGDTKLRLSACEPDFCEAPYTRNEQAPSVCCLPKYVGPVWQSEPQGVEKLRGARNYRLQSLATVVREFLGRYAEWIRARVRFRPHGQQRPLLAGQLPVGAPQSQHHEQTQLGTVSGRARDEQGYGNRQNNAVQPDSERVAGRQADGSAVVSKPVYDIMNCGPRTRFVVRGETAPFIVHNCVQALARDIIAEQAYLVFKALKIRPSLMVHDELVYVVPEDAAQRVLDTVQHIMRTPPAWWPELVTWSEGDIADSYGDAK